MKLDLQNADMNAAVLLAAVTVDQALREHLGCESTVVSVEQAALTVKCPGVDAEVGAAQIRRALGGGFLVETEVGDGVTFTVSLDLSDGEEEPAEGAAEGAEPQKRKRGRPRKNLLPETSAE